MMNYFKTFIRSLTRKKTLDKDIYKTPLRRCLSMPHLACFGIGQMIGAGVYVLTGAVAKTRAGPATVLSYMLAGIVAFISALCYSEMAVRVPLAGSCYSYSYVILGEFIALIIGWNIVLENVVGVASTARAWSGSLDVLLDNVISNNTAEYIGTFNSPVLAKYPDFVGPLLIMALAILIGCGAKISLTFNIVIAVINIVITFIVIISGIVYGNAKNFTEPNGFMPFGFSGVIAGASMCFYAYIGYDAISSAAEETQDPNKSIPIANGLAMSTVMIVYAGMSLALASLVQYTDIDPNSAYTAAFGLLGVRWAEVVVFIGTLVATGGSSLAGLYYAPRIIYAMAEDRILFPFLSYVNPKTKTPLISILAVALVSSILTCLFNVESLAEFSSLGSLIAVTMVAVCVIILRYQTVDQSQFISEPEPEYTSESDSERKQLTISSYANYGLLKPKFKMLPILRYLPQGYGIPLLILIMSISMIVTGLVTKIASEDLTNARPLPVILVIIFSVFAALCCFGMCAFEQNTAFSTYQMPLVPFLPCINIFANIILLMNLSLLAWLRFFVWMIVGLIIYFGYGIHFSKEKFHQKNETVIEEKENDFSKNVYGSTRTSDLLSSKSD